LHGFNQTAFVYFTNNGSNWTMFFSHYHISCTNIVYQIFIFFVYLNEEDGGRNPTWNDKLKWRAEFPGSGADYKLIVKVMDHDTFSSDDFIGEATVHVKELLEMGVEKGTAELRPTKYNIVDSDLSFVGELLIGVSYSLLQDRGMDGEQFGGWKHSQVD
jgi:hypothetical protein